MPICCSVLGDISSNQKKKEKKEEDDRGKALYFFLIDTQIILPITVFERANGTHSRASKATIKEENQKPKKQPTEFQSDGF